MPDCGNASIAGGRQDREGLDGVCAWIEEVSVVGVAEPRETGFIEGEEWMVFEDVLRQRVTRA